MFDGFAEALSTVVTPHGLLLLTAFTLIGTLAALIPGLSPAIMMALLLPLTIAMEPIQALMIMAVLMGAGGFAGSVTSIMINVPGDPYNAPTCLDGYPLARQGKAKVAIGAAAAASALGALVGLVVLVASIPFISKLVLSFGPPEFLALSIAGVALIGVVSGNSRVKGLTSGLLGFGLGLVGVNYVFSGTRYTMGYLPLSDGIPLAPALIGLFAIPALIDLLRHDESVSASGTSLGGSAWVGVMAVLRKPRLLVQSSFIGTGLGVIPGIGATVASWVSYGIAARKPRANPPFGKGNLDGVIAPEAAMDAKEGGSLITLLALGLPASVTSAILLGAFRSYGIFPGATLFDENMALVWVMVLALVFSNVTTSLAGVVLAPAMVKVTLIRPWVLCPLIVAIAGTGSFAEAGGYFGIVVMLVFGVLGLAMDRFGYSRAALIIGMILMPVVESNFHVSTQIYRGGYGFLSRPIVLVIFAIVLLAVVAPMLRKLMVSRSSRARDSDRDSDLGARPIPPTATTDAGEPGTVATPSPASTRVGQRWHVIFIAALLVIGVVASIEAFGFEEGARTMPLLVFPAMTILLVILLVATMRSLIATTRSTLPVVAGSGQPLAEDGDLTGWWWIAGWLVLFPVLVLLLGPIPASGIYVAAFILFFDRSAFRVGRLLSSLAAGVAMTAFIYLVFDFWLGTLH